MKSVKVAIAAAALAAAASGPAPPAHAMMLPGNYDLETNRYTQASWYWFVSGCQFTGNLGPPNLPDAAPPADCIDISAAPRLKFYAYYGGEARLVNGRYTLTVDVPDGVRCPGHNMPSRDTYSWDEVTLFGTIESVYNAGCFGGPGGTQFWTFLLRRL
jgi:hypothetical protein